MNGWIDRRDMVGECRTNGRILRLLFDCDDNALSLSLFPMKSVARCSRLHLANRRTADMDMESAGGDDDSMT